MKHRIEIDGLRALAIIPVLFFHAGFAWMPGGFFGVDIFFVISGFLITGIIVSELHRAGKFSILGFYERRARRIMPALFLVILVIYPVAWFLLFPDMWVTFCQSLNSITYFGSNYFFLGNMGYFDPAIDLNPMLHTWSLAIEEQFYVFFPLIIWLLFKTVKERYWIAILTVVAAASLIWAQNNYALDPNGNFYLLQFRAWELIAGALVALHLNHRNRQSYSGQLFSLFGIGMILYSVFAVGSNQPHPGFITLLPVLGTVLVILFAGPGTLVYRLLSFKIMVWVGLISYSAYLWHQPIFALYKTSALHEPNAVEFLPLIALTLALSWLSWKFVENPFRDRKKFSRKQIFSGTAALAAVVLALSFWGPTKWVSEHRSSLAGLNYQSVQDLTVANHGLSESCRRFVEAEPKCQVGDNPDTLLWGDSYAMHLALALKSSPSRPSFVQQTLSACTPVLGLAQQNSKYGIEFGKQCLKQNDDVLGWLKRHQNIKYVILASPWNLLAYANSNAYDRSGKVSNVGDRAWIALREIVAEIKSLGVKPIIVLPTPTDLEDHGACSLRATVNKADLSECDFALSKNTRAKFVKAMVAGNLGAPTFSLEPMLCPDSICRAAQDGVIIYRDAGHISKAGSEYIGKTYDLGAKLIAAANNG